MESILKILTNGLDFEERNSVIRRVAAMESELKYLIENRPGDLAKAANNGWSVNKIRVVFCLNSFYQRILSSLVASSIKPSVIGAELPIRYGRMLRFDSDRNGRMTEMESNLQNLCGSVEIQPFMLEAQRAADLIWRLSRN